LVIRKQEFSIEWGEEERQKSVSVGKKSGTKLGAAKNKQLYAEKECARGGCALSSPYNEEKGEVTVVNKRVG